MRQNYKFDFFIRLLILVAVNATKHDKWNIQNYLSWYFNIVFNKNAILFNCCSTSQSQNIRELQQVEKRGWYEPHKSSQNKNWKFKQFWHIFVIISKIPKLFNGQPNNWNQTRNIPNRYKKVETCSKFAFVMAFFCRYNLAYGEEQQNVRCEEVYH